MMIFFDIGDTLVDESDFARFRHASVFTFLAQRGIATSEEQYTADLNNLSMRGRMTLFEQLRWFALRGGGTTVQAMEVFRDYILHVAPEAPSRFKPFPDARACLEQLATTHDAHGEPYRLGVIANQPTWIRRSLEQWDLLSSFEPDALVISDEVAVSKPHPEIFQFALKQAGITADEAVMVGNDYFNDIEPAKWLGMRTLWIARDDPYAPGALPVQDPWAADARISSLAEVSVALAKLERLPYANGVSKSPRRKAPAPKSGM
jgi:HAD superfamily hydrolase (TIGR01549 family)